MNLSLTSLAFSRHGSYFAMDQVANLKSLPKTKFHFYNKDKGGYREFEFKSKHLRVYGIVINEGKLIILGGTKANQDNDTTIFRRIKNEYIESIKE